MTTDIFACRQASKPGTLEHGGSRIRAFFLSFLAFLSLVFVCFIFVCFFASAPELEHSWIALDAFNKDAGDKRNTVKKKKKSML